MKLHHHTAVSVVIAGILYLLFKSWSLAAASLISGIFIDLDHFIDVIREHGWTITIREFFDICARGQFHKIVLVWHGWEWIALFGLSSWLTGWNPWVTGVFIGLTHHMILDTIYNKASFLSYSLIWRWKQGFIYDTVFFMMGPYWLKHPKSETVAETNE